MDGSGSGAAQRYEKQMKLLRFGAAGQERLRASRVLLVGCGALGTSVSEQLCRAGVGTISIVDRDLVEWSNLQRQTLFTEQDARRGTPKAEAAKARLAQINGAVRVRACVDDLDAFNVRSYAAECDLIVDCLDNFETRYILNDCAVEAHLPLVYGGAVGLAGMAAGILPVRPVSTAYQSQRATRQGAPLVTWSDEDATPCLRCLAPDTPLPGETATCDSTGVLGATSLLTASLQSMIALRLLAEDAGHGAPMAGVLLRFDLGSADGTFPKLNTSDLRTARDRDCVCCARGVFEHLSLDQARPRNGRTRVLCGRNAVEVHLGAPVDGAAIDRIEVRLRAFGQVQRATEGETTMLLVRLRQDADVSSRGGEEGMRATPRKLTVIASTTATLVLVEGTTDPEVARSEVARSIGV